MTRYYAIFMIIFSLLFAPNSHAANFYWGGRALVSSFELEGLKLSLDGAFGYPSQSVSLNKESDAIAAGAAVFTGLDFNRAGNVPLRLEYEAAFQSLDESVRIHDSFPASGPIGTLRAEAELELSNTFSHSINLYFDIPVGSFPLKPYISGGVGMTYLFYDAYITINRGSNTIEASTSRSGHKRAYYYSVGGGARWALGKRALLDLSLRYMEKQDWNIKMLPLGLKFSTQIMDAGISLQYYF